MTDEVRTSAAVIPYRDPSGRFTSDGNPGRIAGTKNRVAKETLHAVQEMKELALTELRKLVAAGDFKAIAFVLDRILAKNRALQIDDLRPATIAEMLADGELTPSESRDIAATIQHLREIEDLEAMRAKLIELEAIVKDGAQR